MDYKRNKQSYYAIQQDVLCSIKDTRGNPAKHVCIGVLTSGGDSPGMNSALKSIIRTSVKNSISIYGIYRGFEGLIQGDIRKLNWYSEISDSIEGGTQLQTARSKEFLSREGRKKAVYNLIERGINCLIIIGGGGSMSGANLLRNEFGELRSELENEGYFKEYKNKTCDGDCREAPNDVSKPSADQDSRRACSNKGCDDKTISYDNYSTKVTKDTDDLKDARIRYKEDEKKLLINEGHPYKKFAYGINFELRIIGIPGTIDNDIYGTDITLGADTAINRAVELVDRLLPTMRSHNRIFVLECMGNKCGWITLLTAFAVNGDYVLLPETPKEKWREDLLKTIRTSIENHKDGIMVFLCEGAVDIEGNPISLDDIKDLLQDYSVRVFRLGHVQRGGPTMAFDAILGTLGGIKAVQYCLSDDSSPKIVAYFQDRIELADLLTAIEGTKKNEELFSNKQFKELFERRTSQFKSVYGWFEEHRQKKISKYYTRKTNAANANYKVALKHMREDMISRRIASENHSTDTFIDKGSPRLNIVILNDGKKVAGMDAALNMLVQEGLCKDFNVYYSMNGYTGLGFEQETDLYEFSEAKNVCAAVIGTNEGELPNVGELGKLLEKRGIDYLIVIGGNRNIKIAKNVKNVILLPASSDNDVSGTCATIGCDTALNNVASAVRVCKSNTLSQRMTMSILEVGNGSSDYLPVMAGIACGVFEVLTTEKLACDKSKHRDDTPEMLINLKKRIVDYYEENKRTSLVLLKNARTHKFEFLSDVLASDTGISVLCNVLGIFEQGVYPSAYDRILANWMSLEAIKAIEEGVGSGMVRAEKNNISYKRIDMVEEGEDKKQEWLKNLNICSFLE